MTVMDRPELNRPQWRGGLVAPRRLANLHRHSPPIHAAMEGGLGGPPEGLAFYCGVDLGFRATFASGWFGGLVGASSIRLSRCLKPASIRLTSGAWHCGSHFTSRIR